MTKRNGLFGVALALLCAAQSFGDLPAPEAAAGNPAGVNGGPAPYAGPQASIGMSTTASNVIQEYKVITGGSVTMFTSVWNNAAAGSNDLNYAISYSNFAGTSAASNGSTVANNGIGYDFWKYPFDSTGAPFGNNVVTTTVTDPNAVNSPQTNQTTMIVLDHASPDLFLDWANATVDVLPGAPVPHEYNLVITPEHLNEQASPGNHLSLATPGIIGDPVNPTAGLALNYVDSLGDPEITTDLVPFDNLPSDDILHPAGLFHVFFDANAQPGTYHKTFFLGFSDQQDLPGANAPGSFIGELVFTVTVTPEPSSFVLAGLGAAAIAIAWRRRRATATNRRRVD